LLAQAAARSAASVCDQWLNRPPVQLTLNAAVSCIPTFWFHALSHLVNISMLCKLLLGNSQIGCSQVYVSK